MIFVGHKTIGVTTVRQEGQASAVSAAWTKTRTP
jgi:hypothetical protein